MIVDPHGPSDERRGLAFAGTARPMTNLEAAVMDAAEALLRVGGTPTLGAIVDAVGAFEGDDGDRSNRIMGVARAVSELGAAGVLLVAAP